MHVILNPPAIPLQLSNIGKTVAMRQHNLKSFPRYADNPDEEDGRKAE